MITIDVVFRYITGLCKVLKGGSKTDYCYKIDSNAKLFMCLQKIAAIQSWSALSAC